MSLAHCCIGKIVKTEKCAFSYMLNVRTPITRTRLANGHKGALFVHVIGSSEEGIKKMGGAANSIQRPGGTQRTVAAVSGLACTFYLVVQKEAQPVGTTHTHFSTE